MPQQTKASRGTPRKRLTLRCQPVKQALDMSGSQYPRAQSAWKQAPQISANKNREEEQGGEHEEQVYRFVCKLVVDQPPSQ